MLSLKLLSSTWVGALVPEEELKDIVVYIPWGGYQDPALQFLDCSSFISAFPPFPD